MSSSKSSRQTTTIRYAPYIETYHSSFLAAVASYRSSTTGASPFSGWTNIDLTDAFFGSGYTIASFPSLYDMYGKFMAGLDVDVLYTQLYEDTMNSGVINNLVSNEASVLDDDIEANVIPRFELGMRDINSVMSSSFVVGKALIEDARVKSVSKFSAGLKYQMLPIVADRWKTHLEWNKNVIINYAEIIKLYYSALMDTQDMNYSMASQNKLWPFTVLEFERAALGALQGAQNTRTETAGASKVGRTIAGALSGVATGAMVGSMIPGVGTATGAAVGGLLGIASALF